MKKYVAILFLLAACTSSKINTSQKIVTLDASPSYITGGDGTGYFTKWEWKETENNAYVRIEDPSLPITTAIVPVNCGCTFLLYVTDNLNQSDTAALKINVK